MKYVDGLDIWRSNFINKNAVHLYAHFMLFQCVPFIAHRSSDLGGRRYIYNELQSANWAVVVLTDNLFGPLSTSLGRNVLQCDH